MTFKLSASDLKQLIEYFDLRTKNPCRNCGASPSTCCGCKEHTAWISKLKASEAKVRVIPEDVKVLLEAYIATARNINELKKELEAKRRVEARLNKELADYLEEGALQAVKLT